jgi:hypothetical protein
MFENAWQAWRRIVYSLASRFSAHISPTHLASHEIEGVRSAWRRHNLKMVRFLMPVAALATVGLAFVDVERYRQGLLQHSPLHQALALAHGAFLIATLMGLRYCLPRWHTQALRGDSRFVLFLALLFGSVIAMSLLGIIDRGSTTLISIALMLMNLVFRLPIPVIVVVNLFVLPSACILRFVFGTDFTSVLIAMLELMSLSAITAVTGYGLSRQTVQNVLGELREARRSQKYMEELEIAAHMQRSLLPRQWPSNAAFSLAGLIKPAKEVCGDYFDHFALSDGRHAMVLADVCDKGVAAGLFGMMCMTASRSAILHHTSIEEAFASINQDLCTNNDECMFVTCVGLSYDPSTGIVHLVNAGHIPPLLIRASGELQWVSAPRCPPLGVPAGKPFGSIEFQLHPGDSLLLMTDGVTEALNVAGEEFGLKRVEEALRGVQVTDATLSIVTLTEVIEVYSRQIEQTDDIACLSLLHKGLPAEYQKV